MADYAAPSAYPYVDSPAISTPLLSADYNALVAEMVDLGGASGRVKSLETSGVRAVIVTTGNEVRPTPSPTVVAWVSPSGITPTNALANDLVFMPAGGSADTQAPTAPTSLAASSITATGFHLAWTASTDNVAVTGYQVEVGGTVFGSPTTNAFDVTGLSGSTNYSVRVRARDAAANWSSWTSISGGVTTGASPDTTAPTAPTGLAASSITASGFVLNWTASTDNVAVTGYDVELNGTIVGTPTGTTYTASGLTASTNYTVRVRARDAAGNTSSWTAISGGVTTSASSDTTAPTTPTSLAASSITSTGFTLSWTASTDNVAVTGYDVEIAGTIVATPTASPYAATGLTASTNYTVRVRARDAAGNTSSWAAISGGVTTSSGASALFTDTFNRANGAVGNGWTGPSGSTLNIVSNALAPTGWSAYDLVRQPGSGFPRAMSVRAVFAGTIGTYQGIFISDSNNTGTGIRLFNSGGTWVIGNSATYNGSDTNVAFTNTPSTPYTSLRLDFDGTTVTAYINGVVVHTASLASLGISIDTVTTSTYRAGYCGEAGKTAIDNFEVWAA